MYTNPVSRAPSKYTFKIAKYSPNFFGWEIVGVDGRVFEFPPGTTKNVSFDFLVKILRTKSAPYYRNLLAFELKPSYTMDGTKPGYYRIGKSFVRVALPKPQQITHYSEETSELPEGRPVFGDSGILFRTKVGEVELEYALVSSRAIMDMGTFYKNILVYTNWIGAVYLGGNEGAFSLLTKSRFTNDTETKCGQHMVLADGRLKSCTHVAEPIY